MVQVTVRSKVYNTAEPKENGLPFQNSSADSAATAPELWVEESSGSALSTREVLSEQGYVAEPS